MPKAYFEATNFALGRINSLFDFVWPTAAALWNLRWQVRGFMEELPGATQEDLIGRFTAGSGIHGTDLRKTCIETSWADQKAVFSGFILTNAFAIYEHWSDDILMSVGDNVPRANHPLQFDQPGRGLQSWMASKLANISTITDTQFYPSYRADSKYSWPLAGNLMKSYRYFKQARNSLIHRGGIADATDERAYIDFVPVSGRAALGMAGNLEHEPFVTGQPIRLHLRGTVGFCDILIRLMRSIDAELCRSALAEKIAEERLRVARGHTMVLAADTQRRVKKINKICKAANLPKPQDPQAVYQFMIDKRILHI